MQKKEKKIRIRIIFLSKSAQRGPMFTKTGKSFDDLAELFPRELLRRAPLWSTPGRSYLLVCTTFPPTYFPFSAHWYLSLYTFLSSLDWIPKSKVMSVLRVAQAIV